MADARSADMTRLSFLMLCGGLVTACDSSTKESSAATVVVAGCAWPASLEPTDAGDGRCRAKRHRLMCQASTGSRAFCISNDPTQCEDLSGTSPGVTYTCTDECDPSEYAIVCGGIGPMSGSFTPPPDCRKPGITPGGIVFYCCPCGSP